MTKSINMKNSRLRIVLVAMMIVSLLFASVTTSAYAASNSTDSSDDATMILVSMGVISADSNGD